MKAVQILGDRGAHRITVTDSLAKPVPEGRDVLVKVFATGITADEVSWLELYDTSNRVPGHDISGVIEAFGPEYNGPFSIGDNVFAMLRADAPQGGQAEYAIASPDELALKPASISHAEAAALPIPILTAWEAIFKHAQLAKGSKILVTGASGAVGAIVVQIASRVLDAEVVALASPQNHARLKQLGASEVVDYHSPDWQQTVTDVDAVFDTAGGETLEKTWDVVKEDGVIVTVADPPPPWAFSKEKPVQLQEHPNVRWIYFIVSASSSTLKTVADLLNEGAVKPLDVKTFPFKMALEAWEYGRQRGRPGKVVIEFARE